VHVPRVWVQPQQHRFSTNSQAAESEGPASPKPPTKRTTRRRIAPISMTDRAAERLRDLVSKKPDKIGIRLGVKRRGCNGLSYTLNYADSKPENDEEVVDKGVTIFIEPMALFHLVGTVMDWEETPLAAEFTFNNPNEKGRCGCGESFNV